MKKESKLGGELRQSQLLTTFGPGAMVDLPEHSIVISGLSHWKGKGQPIWEDRLRAKVAKTLGVEDIKFYSPPTKTDDKDDNGVNAFIFPAWFLGQVEDDRTHKVKGKEYRTRPLLRWSFVKDGAKFEGKKIKTVPVRFVQACTNGHLDDIDWYAFVHANSDSNTNCRGQLWLDEAGSGNDFEEIFVRCEVCKSRRPLSQAKVNNSKVLGKCQGKRPWLGKNSSQKCWCHEVDKDGNIVTTDKPEYNRLLVRSASNAYFSQTLSVISLPDADAALKTVLDKFYEGDLEDEESKEDLAKTLIKKSKYTELGQFDIDIIWAEIERRRSGQGELDKTIKQVELEALLSCSPETGKPAPNHDDNFDARDRNLDLDGFDQKWRPFIDKIVLVHRLREVIVQIGFTRFQPSIPDIEGELENIDINVRRGELDFETDWLPAIENKGEGVFIALSKSQVEAWVKKPEVIKRGQKLTQGFNHWLDNKGISRDKFQFPGLPFIMLHSLSHMLITAVSLDCGYAASAIKERIYANTNTGYGILLYTGSSGSEGTLGGLVEVGRNIEKHLARALELGRLCSNDPVCAQHDPTNSQEERFLHGSACHGCLLIAETSCEQGNELLDRALVVSTVEELGAEFFPDTALCEMM